MLRAHTCLHQGISNNIPNDSCTVARTSLLKVLQSIIQDLKHIVTCRPLLRGWST